MSDQILYAQQNLEDIITKLTGVRTSLNQVGHTLLNVNTAARAGGDYYIGTSIGLSGQGATRVEGTSVRESVRSFRTATDAAASYAESLSRTLRQVSEQFASTEQLLQTGRFEEGNSTSGGSGGQTDAGTTDQGSFFKLPPWVAPVLWSIPPFNMIMPTIYGAELIRWFFSDMEWSTKFKSKIKLFDSEDGWKDGNFGIEAGIQGHKHIWQDSVGDEGEYGSWSDTLTFGGAEATGDIGFTLFKDGKFSPDIHADVGVEGYVFKTELEGQLGSDEYNIHGGADTQWLGAGAKAKGYAGAEGVGFEAGAEAYVAKGEIKGGFTIFGIKIDVSGEAMVGWEAKAKGKIGGDGIETEGGFGPFGLSLKIDWSGFKLW